LAEFPFLCGSMEKLRIPLGPGVLEDSEAFLLPKEDL
jgi:hypothetical protein